jgi:hypothetical protein
MRSKVWSRFTETLDSYLESRTALGTFNLETA